MRLVMAAVERFARHYEWRLMNRLTVSIDLDAV